MRNLLGALVALQALLGMMFAASAADLGAKYPIKAAPPIVEQLTHGWSGWIVSAVAGGDWNNFQFNGFGNTAAQKPSDFAVGGMSDLLYEFGNGVVIGHELVVRYGNPSVAGQSAPYWRGNSDAIIGFDAGPFLPYVGIGVAAQTLKINLFGTGATDPTFGWDVAAGLKYKVPTTEWVFGLRGYYENMNGFAIGPISTQASNLGVLGSVGYEFQ